MKKEHCSRCNAELRSSIMSKFNDEIICLDCKADEREAPGYKAASEAEIEAVRSGNRNFPGVGLSSQDRQFLGERLRKRADIKNEREILYEALSEYLEKQRREERLAQENQ
jgi:hypothetical protein